MNFGCTDGCQSLNKSPILKFEKNSDPDLDSQMLEQERNRSLKMWLQPPPGTWSLVDLCAAFLRV